MKIKNDFTGKIVLMVGIGMILLPAAPLLAPIVANPLVQGVNYWFRFIQYEGSK